MRCRKSLIVLTLASAHQYSLEQMMYEVIANAEDAGAHRVVLVLDERDYSDKGALVSPEMADQMGPALLIYNGELGPASFMMLTK